MFGFKSQINPRLILVLFLFCISLLALNLDVFFQKTPEMEGDQNFLFCGAEQTFTENGKLFFENRKIKFEEGQCQNSDFSRHGYFSAKTDSVNPTAFGFFLDSLVPGTHLQITVWRLNPHGFGYLVADASWGEFVKISSADSADEKGWERLRANITLPPAQGFHQIKMYCLALESFGEPVYFDDFEVKILEAGHQQNEEYKTDWSLFLTGDVIKKDNLYLTTLFNFLPESLKIWNENEKIGVLEAASPLQHESFTFTSIDFPNLLTCKGSKTGTVYPRLTFRELEPQVLARFDLKKNLRIPSFIKIKAEEWIIPKGQHRLDQPFVVPIGKKLILEAGANVEIVKEGLILSYSSIQSNGEVENPVRIYSSGLNGIAIIQAADSSSFLHTHFSRLGKFHFGNWCLTGAVNAIESNISFTHCTFEKSNAEDGLNLVRLNLSISHSVFSNPNGDGLDVDFGKGVISHCAFSENRNDGLDLSGSQVKIFKLTAKNNGDKGLSIGEASTVYVSGFQIEKSNIGIAAKDGSLTLLTNGNIHSCHTGLSSFTKKFEFGPARLVYKSVSFSNNVNDCLAEDESEILKLY